jgi:hypothetical protein
MDDYEKREECFRRKLMTYNSLKLEAINETL